jgi:hypothetical protein
MHRFFFLRNLIVVLRDRPNADSLTNDLNNFGLNDDDNNEQQQGKNN